MEKAKRRFERLQLEIAEESNDMSLFARLSHVPRQMCNGLLAPSPREFSVYGLMVKYRGGFQFFVGKQNLDLLIRASIQLPPMVSRMDSKIF
jgi:hypothetical protein